jgi:hypothetical protein
MYQILLICGPIYTGSYPIRLQHKKNTTKIYNISCNKVDYFVLRGKTALKFCLVLLKITT